MSSYDLDALARGLGVTTDAALVDRLHAMWVRLDEALRILLDEQAALGDGDDQTEEYLWQAMAPLADAQDRITLLSQRAGEHVRGGQ